MVLAVCNTVSYDIGELANMGSDSKTKYPVLEAYACSICLFKNFLATVKLFLTMIKKFDHGQKFLPMQNFWNLSQKVLDLSKMFWTYSKYLTMAKKICKQSKKFEPADGIGIIG